MVRALALALVPPLVLAPGAALARPDIAPETSVFDGDYVTIGGGVIVGPSYDGSDDMVVSPLPVIQGSLAGIGIAPRPGGVALDLIPDEGRQEARFSFGPTATFSRNRHSQIEDPVVRAAGKLKSAIDAGVSAGVAFPSLLNPYDRLSVSADLRWNINQAHRGRTISPAISYVTPLSRAAGLTVVFGAKHVDGDYARYYYGVTPAQATATGLPAFAAKGGWASVSASVLAGYDLSGDARDGGFALFALGSYARLLGDARRTPWTSLRGDADQLVLGAGLGYTF